MLNKAKNQYLLNTGSFLLINQVEVFNKTICPIV